MEIIITLVIVAFLPTILIVIHETVAEMVRNHKRHRRVIPLPTEPEFYISQITAVGEHTRQSVDSLFEQFLNDMQCRKGDS